MKNIVFSLILVLSLAIFVSPSQLTAQSTASSVANVSQSPVTAVSSVMAPTGNVASIHSPGSVVTSSGSVESEIDLDLLIELVMLLMFYVI